MLAALSPDWPDLPGVQAFTFTRGGGVSQGPYASLNLAFHVDDAEAAVAANRVTVEAWLPGAPNLQWLQQVHGTRVIDLPDVAAVTRAPIEADGLITSAPGIACCVMTADCLPVFLASARGDEVALVHAGWRGLAGGIIERAIAGMKTPPDNVRVWLGPAIAACHFEVGTEVREAIVASTELVADSRQALLDCFQPAQTPDKFMADLYAIARHKLMGLGVTQVSGGEYCSYCDAQQFFSYRRDGRTGRNLSVIYLQGR
jgi:YfiH family protein